MKKRSRRNNNCGEWCSPRSIGTVVLVLACLGCGFLFGYFASASPEQQQEPPPPRTDRAFRGLPEEISAPQVPDVDEFALLIAQLLTYIENRQNDFASETLKHLKTEWKRTAEVSSLACFVSWEKGRKKKARKYCRQALNSQFKMPGWKGKHLAYNAVSSVFERMEEPGAAINAARKAASFAGDDDATGVSFQMRLVQLLWRRGACADMREVVDILQKAVRLDNPSFSGLLGQTLEVAQQSLRQMCSFHALPSYVQQVIQHPELLLLADKHPSDPAGLQFRHYLQLHRSGHFAPRKGETPQDARPGLDGVGGGGQDSPAALSSQPYYFPLRGGSIGELHGGGWKPLPQAAFIAIPGSIPVS